ncbi:MAG: hypothetical protein Ct9H300mP6_15270 [Gammaproteobacteria bacterium]|nr:MAG: hypothetical protein Ct9H300mP6_15270 [Gammaproteobacteria bacterium]
MMHGKVENTNIPINGPEDYGLMGDGDEKQNTK